MNNNCLVQPASEENTDSVLVVDLDGTLCQTDTLHEGVLQLCKTEPLTLLRLPKWLYEGRAALKTHVADIHILDPDTLPMNDQVIELLQSARAKGQKTALVSAADHRQVTAVAQAIGLFDEAYGSAEGRNLKGAVKAEFLTERFGHKKFDYIGDSRADLPVWTVARHAVTVNAGARLRQAADDANPITQHLSSATNYTGALFKALRPHQWSKNTLLFLPMLATHGLSQFVAVFLGFWSFCLLASAAYIINDLMDLNADRIHPRKRLRPFASGALTALDGARLVCGLLLASLILGMLTRQPLFLVVLALYFVVTLTYSLWLKRKLIVDVLALAGLYTVRVIAGAAAAAAILSPWMLGFSMFLFLALAAVKRQAELMDLTATGRESAGRAYEAEDLPILRGIALSASHAAVLVFALYISSDAVQTLYSQPEVLWLIPPLLLYWLLRMIMKTHRGQMTDDPIVYATQDPSGLALIVACASVVASAI